jgi:hypothetical protein
LCQRPWQEESTQRLRAAHVESLLALGGPIGQYRLVATTDWPGVPAAIDSWLDGVLDASRRAAEQPT